MWLFVKLSNPPQSFIPLSFQAPAINTLPHFTIRTVNGQLYSISTINATAPTRISISAINPLPNPYYLTTISIILSPQTSFSNLSNSVHMKVLFWGLLPQPLLYLHLSNQSLHSNLWPTLHYLTTVRIIFLLEASFSSLSNFISLNVASSGLIPTINPSPTLQDLTSIHIFSLLQLI